MSASVGIRPEKISLSRTAPESGDMSNCVQGEVVEKAYMGGYTLYHLKLATGMMLKANVTNSIRHSAQDPQWGDKIWASWSKSDMMVLTQ